MNDPENFLARWSRRKHQVGSGDVAPEPDVPATPPAALEAEMAALAAPENTSPESTAPSSDQPPAPAFDPASLPSLDSIGADTDIRGFLAPGVPAELAQAALRRVWVADPGIRDFKGLADYDWDFTAPNSMLGFGDLDPSTDVPKMLADVFGEKLPDLSVPAQTVISEIPAPAPPTPLESLTSEWQHGQDEPSIGEVSVGPDGTLEQQSEEELLRRNVNVAMQNEIVTDEDAQPMPRRQHGGALPQ